jgi:hypothetical protein
MGFWVAHDEKTDQKMVFCRQLSHEMKSVLMIFALRPSTTSRKGMDWEGVLDRKGSMINFRSCVDVDLGKMVRPAMIALPMCRHRSGLDVLICNARVVMKSLIVPRANPA